MMKSLITAGLLSLCCASAGAAETWQYEAAVLYSGSKQDSAPNADTSVIGAGIGYAFSPLPSTGNYPLAEAQFAERVGNVALTYISGSAKSDIIENTDVDSFGATVTLMQPNDDFAIQLGYSKLGFADTKIKNSTTQVKIDVDSFSVAAGYFVQKYLLVAIEHRKESADYTYQPSAASNDSDTTTNQLILQYLAELTNGSFFAGILSIGKVDATSTNNPDESNRTVAFRGTYYPNKNHGVSLELGQNSGDDLSKEGNWYKAGYQGFVADNISISASYQKFSAKDSSQSPDEATTMAGMSIRF